MAGGGWRTVVVAADRELIRVNFGTKRQRRRGVPNGERRKEEPAVQRLCPVVILAPAPSHVHPRSRPLQTTSVSSSADVLLVVAQAHFTRLPFSPLQRLGHVVASDPTLAPSWENREISPRPRFDWGSSNSSAVETRRATESAAEKFRFSSPERNI